MRKMTRTLNNAPEGGIGDDAYFSKDKSMPFPTLTVKKGRYLFRGNRGGSRPCLG